MLRGLIQWKSVLICLLTNFCTKKFHLTLNFREDKTLRDTHRFKRLCIVFAVTLFLLGMIACSDKSSKVISSKLMQSGKPTAPISISYAVPEKADVGESITVTVEFKTLSDANRLKLKLTAGKGLDLTSGEYEIDYGNQSMNSAFSETVTVVPQTEGILYLNVFVTGTFHGNTMVRTGAVPINAGRNVRQMLKKPSQVTTDSEGQKIIIMPAEEENKKAK